MTTQPSPEIRERVSKLLVCSRITFEKVQGGYTPAERWLVKCDSGMRAFVKIGTTPLSSTNLRAEYDVYAMLSGLFMPRFLGWEDHEVHPLMAIEDLSASRWPPPWDAKLIKATLIALEALHACRVNLSTFDATLRKDASRGWLKVAKSPKPFLELGLVTDVWLSNTLPVLINQSELVDTSGSAPIHCDLRSDNLCLTPRGVVLVDWSFACLGNPMLDIGFLLPSLHAEGGPMPEEILPNSPDIAAYVSGYFASRAGLPEIPSAPFVRQVQRQQLSTALPWAVRALSLPPMDGPELQVP